jgi:hypothetical protein
LSDNPRKVWCCQCFGMGAYGFVVFPPDGKAPNLFWCWMQFLLVGNRWVLTEASPMLQAHFDGDETVIRWREGVDEGQTLQ